MKKATFVLVLVSTLVGQTLCAQDFAAAKTANVPAVYTNNTEADATAGAPVIAKPDVKLVNKLTTLFPTATSQIWRLFNGCYHVSFQNGAQKARAVFTPKGKLNYAILDCSKSELPASLKRTIDQEYGAYQLRSAIQINAYEAFAHQAVLENGVELVTLKATIDGVEVVSRVKK